MCRIHRDSTMQSCRLFENLNTTFVQLQKLQKTTTFSGKCLNVSLLVVRLNTYTRVVSPLQVVSW